MRPAPHADPTPRRYPRPQPVAVQGWWLLVAAALVAAVLALAFRVALGG